VEGNRLDIFHRRRDQWQAIAHTLFDTFVRPRAKREEAWRKEFILNVVLLVVIAVLFVFGLIVAKNVVMMGADYRGVPLKVFSCAFLFIVLLYGLSRAGFRLFASYALVAALFIGNASANFHWGIDIPGILLSYGFIVVMTGILINSWAALAVTIAISAVLNGVGYLQLQGIIRLESHWRSEQFTQRDGIEFSLYFLMITAISWLSNREIEQSMHRAFRSERALLAQREQLEQLVEQRTLQLREVQMERIDQLYRFAEFGKMASGFFHDLSTPLATLQLYLDEIELGSTQYAIANVQHDIQKAQEVALHMESFTKSMKRQLRESSVRQMFSVPDEIRNVVQIMNHRILTSMTEVTVHCTEEMHTYGNPLRFHQVILNLVSNSIDAYEQMPLEPNRTVAIHAEFTDAHKSMIEIMVHDNGIGLSEDVAIRIFEPFFSTKSDMTNMGIGLATTKKIVEKDFNGTISVKSSKDDGTTFTIRIPKIYEPTASITH
jgi:signal transduction histidine kinase